MVVIAGLDLQNQNQEVAKVRYPLIGVCNGGIYVDAVPGVSEQDCGLEGVRARQSVDLRDLRGERSEAKRDERWVSMQLGLGRGRYSRIEVELDLRRSTPC